MKSKLGRLIVLLFVVTPLHAALAQSSTPPAPVVSAQHVADAFAAAGIAASAAPMTKVDYGAAPLVCKGVKFAVPATEPPVNGRVFYCARKADGERLESYYTNVWRRNPAEAVHVLTQRPFVFVLDKAAPADVVEKFRAALSAFTQGGSVAAPVSPISVKVGTLSYMRWGKPHYMNDPKSSCTATDDSHAVLMLKVPVDITNNSSRTMQVGAWHGMFYRYDGSPATTCYFSASGRQTKDPLKNEWDRAAATRTAQDTIESREAFSIPPGSTASLTYAVFVEINERVKYGEIVDAALGASNRIEVPPTVPVP